MTDDRVCELYQGHQKLLEERMAERYVRLWSDGPSDGPHEARLQAAAMFSMAEQFAFRFFNGRIDCKTDGFVDAVRTISRIGFRANSLREPPADFDYNVYGFNHPEVVRHLREFRVRMDDLR